MTHRHAAGSLIGPRPFQLGYVTTDVDRAVAHFGRELAAPDFAVSERTLRPTSAKGELTMDVRLGMAFTGDTMIELIQPVGDDVELYTEVLPESGYATVLHHLAYLLTPDTDWTGFRSGVDDAQLVIEFRGDPSYLYLDTRGSLGHYVEYLWMSEERTATLLDPLPRN